MPQLLREQGYRFYFYSNKRGEPPHVHVDKSGDTAKLCLKDLAVARNSGYSPFELAHIRRIIMKHRFDFLRRWHEHFGLET